MVILDVYKIEVIGLGSSYLERDIKNIPDMLEDLEVGGGYEITKMRIAEKDYNKLPEFQGF